MIALIRSLQRGYCLNKFKPRYNLIDIKSNQLKWQQIWQKQSTLQKGQPPNKEKFYCLAQFPYPSGNLHLGHARVYYISDTISRFQTLRGKYVIHPMGWDSFGLPAENAAISRKVDPLQWTQQNIKDMKYQMLRLGVKFDWSRELMTHRVQYYKWTQHIFQALWDRGLAYKKVAEVNWDPVDKTVLANEQVDQNGCSWRSGAKVEKKYLEQYFLKITEFAEELESDLNRLSKWPDKVKQMQKGWIGRKVGHKVRFQKLQNQSQNNKRPIGQEQFYEVFTTRIQTLMGCTFLTVPATNEAKDGTKIGECLHPLTNQRLPVYAADYVVMDVGTSCVMGVPAHDQNDALFASKHKLSSKTVLDQLNGVVQNSGEYSGLKIIEARQKIAETLNNKGLCERHIHLRMRDWLVSRQRYWGTPIPIIYCKACGPVKAPLPVVLPQCQNSKLSSGVNPLKSAHFQDNVPCPKCGGHETTRESDTLDTFVDSSWYYLRFLDSLNKDQLCDKQKAGKYMPVDVYIGGIEHAIMHLLYARFINKALHKQRKVVHDEPFAELIVQGMVKGKTYRLKSNGEYLTKQRLKQLQLADVEESFEKMSKSKYNGVNPIDIVDKYGADPLRLSLMFSAPVEKDIQFREEEVQRMYEFIGRVESLYTSILAYSEQPSEDRQQAQRAVVKRISELIEQMSGCLDKTYSPHVYVARNMEYFNFVKETLKKGLASKQLLKEIYRIGLVTLNPVCPHFCNQMLQLHYQSPAKQTTWPDLDQLKNQYSVGNKPEFSVQVSINGKYVGKFELPKSDFSQSDDRMLIAQHILPKLSGRHKFQMSRIAKVIKIDKPAEQEKKPGVINIILQKPGQ